MDGSHDEAFWRTRAEQLEHALTARVVVEQAKGMLAERLGLDLDGAFEVMRYAARSTQAKVQAVAQEVVDSEETPPAVVQALARHAALLARGPRRDRVAQTERFFQAINAEIARHGVATLDYVCECPDPSCVEAIALDADDLARIHARPDLFVVAPGHEVPGVDTVVERAEGYLIVRKDR